MFLGWIRKSTVVTVSLGVFVDATDAVTEETGLAGTMAVKVSKNGAASVARNSGTAIVHDTGQDGHYLVELSATDTDTSGRIRLSVQDAATHRPVVVYGQVVEQQVWDSYFSTDKLQVDMREIAGNTTPATNLGLGIPPNFKDMAITVTTGRVTAGTVSDKAGYSISGTKQTLDALKDYDPATQTVDVGAIAGSTVAATNLKHGGTAMVNFTATGGGHSTTLINTDLTSTQNNLYVGRFVYGTISGVFQGEATLITGYNGSTKALTVATMTQTPLDGQTMVIA